MKNNFKTNLKLLRTEANIGQIELARAIGVSNGIISLWENEKREPTMSYIILLAKYFNVTTDYLLGLED